jgi:hypothetical protein
VRIFEVGSGLDGLRRQSRNGRKPLMATDSGPSRHAPEWRNWQTRGTQNPEPRKGREGSTPSSGTSPSNDLRWDGELPEGVEAAAPPWRKRRHLSLQHGCRRERRQLPPFVGLRAPSTMCA